MTVTSERQTTVVGKLTNVNKFYGNRRILDDISLEVRANEIVALVGRSGCGKSTVLRVLAGLSDDHAGNREVSGAPAVAFQEPRLFPWRNVLTNVQYGLTRTTLSREAARARSELALAEIGLTDHAQSWPLTLSGGQAQRVSLARIGGRTGAAAARRAVRRAGRAHPAVHAGVAARPVAQARVRGPAGHP